MRWSKYADSGRRGIGGKYAVFDRFAVVLRLRMEKILTLFVEFESMPDGKRC